MWVVVKSSSLLLKLQAQAVPQLAVGTCYEGRMVWHVNSTVCFVMRTYSSSEVRLCCMCCMLPA